MQGIACELSHCHPQKYTRLTPGPCSGATSPSPPPPPLPAMDHPLPTAHSLFDVKPTSHGTPLFSAVPAAGQASQSPRGFFTLKSGRTDLPSGGEETFAWDCCAQCPRDLHVVHASCFVTAAFSTSLSFSCLGSSPSGRETLSC